MKSPHASQPLRVTRACHFRATPHWLLLPSMFSLLCVCEQTCLAIRGNRLWLFKHAEGSVASVYKSLLILWVPIGICCFFHLPFKSLTGLIMAIESFTMVSWSADMHVCGSSRQGQSFILGICAATRDLGLEVCTYKCIHMLFFTVQRTLPMVMGQRAFPCGPVLL